MIIEINNYKIVYKNPGIENSGLLINMDTKLIELTHNIIPSYLDVSSIGLFQIGSNYLITIRTSPLSLVRIDRKFHFVDIVQM